MNKFDRNTCNLVMCIGEAVIGILLLINPIGFTSSIIVTLGAILTLLGSGCLFSYFNSAPEAASQENSLAKGLLFVIIGLFCMFRSEWFVVTFPIPTVLYGILTLVTGINKIQWAVDMLRMKQKYWYVAVIGAALTLVFATLILSDPFASTAILWTFIAVSMIIEAAVDIVTFVFGKKEEKALV